MNKNYDDIINLPHFESKKHPRMSIENRSFQFAPFNALTGYDDAIKEQTRQTSKKIELDEDAKNILNTKLQYLIKNIDLKPKISITYFIPDKQKEGGKYVFKDDYIKKIDLIEQVIIFLDKTKISINNIISIDSPIFKNIDI